MEILRGTTETSNFHFQISDTHTSRMKGLVVVVLCASICQSWAWGEEGHMIIAQIAATRLTSAANKVLIIALDREVDPF